MTNHLLFREYPLRAVLAEREHELREEIDAIDGTRLLNTSVDDLCDYVVSKYAVRVPQLDEDGIQVDHKETKVDVGGSRIYSVDKHEPLYVPGTSFYYYVPFAGEPLLFECRPSHYDFNPPRACVSQEEIVLIYTTTGHDAKGTRSSFERDIGHIREYLGWVATDVKPFNTSLRGKVRARVEARREKLLKDQGVVASLGFPLRRRTDAPRTYVSPVVRRKVRPTLPPASSEPYIPEPTLDMQEYEHILSIIQNMVMVMERSPKAFRDMSEEDIRQHFLVQLNGHYEGQATGETFNFEGKTDILIREKGKNIFIAECKVWRGPKSLKGAIDQILGYATWRDTKLAILIFNRRGAFSDVVTKIPAAVKAHPNFKRELLFGQETGYRCVIRHRDDPNREMILTVLAFEVPA